MRSGRATTIFATTLWFALLCTTVVDIYALGHFEGAIGDRIDNLKINAVGDVLIALVVTFGFAGYLVVRRVRALPVTRARVLRSAVLVGALVYVLGLVGGELPDLFGYWQLNVSLFVASCLAFGVFVAAALAGFLTSRRYAA